MSEDAFNSELLDDSDLITEGPRIRKPSAKVLAAREDVLPVGPGPLPEPQPMPALPRVILHLHERIRTLPNRFRLSREYRRRPTRIPDMDPALTNFAIRPTEPRPKKRLRRIKDIIYPYPNVSAFLFGHWHRKGSDKKTKGERDKMLELFEDPRFDSKEVRGINFEKIDKLLAQDVQSPWDGPGWKTSTVTIEVPAGIKRTKDVRKERNAQVQFARRHDEVDSEADDFPVHRFQVHDVHTRSLVNIMKEVVTEDPASANFHWHGFEEFWEPPDPAMPMENVYSELYSSEAFRIAERRLLAQPPEPGCDLPRVIFAYMFGSDSTHVAQFGQASLWPGYAYPGNCSKYTRSKPTVRMARHFVFFPKVSTVSINDIGDKFFFQLADAFDDFLQQKGVSNTAQLKAHCRRELFHAVWRIILGDPEFREAYKHGIVLECTDGIKRRFYLCIFTYSADYPEK